MSIDLAIGTFSINLAITIPPLLLIVLGVLALMVIPKKPNWIMGYKTSRSRQNQDTWAFAHRYWGKQAIAIGIILTVLTIVGLVLIEQGTFTLDPNIFLGLSAIVTVVAITITMIPTEIALKREFDENGKRRQ